MPRPKVYQDDNARQAAYRERVRQREAEAERRRLMELQERCLHRYIRDFRHDRANQYRGYCNECSAIVYFSYSGRKVEP